MHSILHLLPLLAETSNNSNSGSAVPGLIGGIVGYVLFVIAVWPMLNKAGQPGWTALIPIIALFFIVRASGLSAWFGLLYFVPIANIVISIIVAIRLGRGFGHGTVFSIFLLWLLSIIGYLFVAFSSDTYDRGRI